MSNSNPIEQRQPRTVVEQGTRIKGTLASSCPIDVHGRIEGELETPALYVSASGALHGRAKVGTIRSEGEISGELDADHVELAGRVLDNTIIRARSLCVNLASDSSRLQVTFGECELSVGDEPAERVSEVESRAAVTPEITDLPSIAAKPSTDAVEPSVAEAPLAPPVTVEPVQAPPLPPVTVEPFALLLAMSPPVDALSVDSHAELEADAHGDSLGAEATQRRKRKNGAGDDRAHSGWSHPPSQPPPGS